MIPKWSFRSAFMRRRMTDERKLCFRNQTMRTADWVLCHPQLLAAEQRGQNQLRYVFRERRNCRHDQRGRPAEKDSYGERLIHFLRNAIMKAAALLNLPMQPRGPRIVDLHPVNPQIMFLCDWVFRIDQRERDEWPAVFMPSRKHRQLIESHRWFDDLRHRPTRSIARAEFEKV